SDATPAGLMLEDRRVRCWSWRLDARAISHASQERLVSEILFIKVRREHDELLKRDFDLLSGVQREIIDASFQRHDPAVQKILWRDSLATKVVNNECAAI